MDPPKLVLQESLSKILGDFQPAEGSLHSVEAQSAAYLAAQLQDRANHLQTPQERRQQAELDRMIQHPDDKITLVQMTDQAFRSRRPTRAVDQLVHILDVQGIPRFFTHLNRMMLKGFQSFGGYLPGVAVPLVKEKMHQETANVILPAEMEHLTVHLHSRRDEGVRMNVNFLGEALLGEREAENRLKQYLAALQQESIEVISVKISTLYSQISPLARRHTLGRLRERLELLFRAAARSHYTRADGTNTPKLVYLDMEEYRDMSLTAEAFMSTLDRPGLLNATGGIVLQSYIPDSFATQQRLAEWARQRVARGGSPVTLRIVKGANMQMECIEASLESWPQAPFKEKQHTDANFKRMLQFGMREENLAAIRLGIASHNLFDVAYGLVLAVRQNALDQIQFEMLEGMANHQRRALFELCGNLLLYAPACRKEEFIHAIGYLVRRLDENTGPHNFLRYAFRLRTQSPEWRQLESQFFDSFACLPRLRETSRRVQDRSRYPDRARNPDHSRDIRGGVKGFVNEPNTDFSLPRNQSWAARILQRWQVRCNENAAKIPLVIQGNEIWRDDSSTDRQVRRCMDPSRPGVELGSYVQATRDDIEAAVAVAYADPDGWRALRVGQRGEVLARVADEIRRARGELIGAALADGGKLVTQSDPEVSEAVDFVEFYARTSQDVENFPGIKAGSRGVVAVVSPWNFPIAIPCGGIAAGLAASNTVILKPASHTVLTAWYLCQCFWRGGVSQNTLQLVPCSGSMEGQQLVSDPRVDTVVLTGGTETALNIMRHRPQTRLLAETGGKNATIVTALADRDQAIKQVLDSAFGHSGQKCSATSLLLLEDEVYEDAAFRDTLCDATTSLHVGSAWELHTKVGPLIQPPSGALERAIKELEPGESWAVIPHQDHDNPHLVSPGIKWGVQPDSFTHCTELFGPVLGVMRFRDLHEAIELVNRTGFGLTSGLQSLDEREQTVWRESIRAGNLYINRGTTGAIVLRQPFGGMGKSVFGPGIKAGGPNYVAQLMRFEKKADPPHVEEELTQVKKELEATRATFLDELLYALVFLPKNDTDFPGHVVREWMQAVASYKRNHTDEFSQQHDHFRLVGQDNYRTYLPIRELRVRIHSDDTVLEILSRIAAARVVGCRTTVSYNEGCHGTVIQRLDRFTEPWAAAIEFVEEDDQGLEEAIRDQRTHRVRYAAAERVPTAIRLAAAESAIYIADEPVLPRGRIELPWYLEEQSLSHNYHRYGNLGARSEEKRSPVA